MEQMIRSHDNPSAAEWPDRSGVILLSSREARGEFDAIEESANV
jgi:hypothetical protein